MVEDGIGYRAAVSYRYTVDGETHVGSRVFFGDDNAGSLYPAVRRVSRYPVDADVQVAYDPADPSLCVLEAGASWLAWGSVLIGILFIVVAIVATRA